MPAACLRGRGEARTPASGRGCSHRSSGRVRHALAASRQPLRYHDLQPLRPIRPQAAGDLARAVAQFRRRHAASDQARDLPQGLRPRHHPFRSRQQLRPAARLGRDGVRRDPAHRLSPAIATSCHLDQGRLSDVAGTLWRMGQPQISARQPRPEPEADGARLCRHLLFAPLRSRDAAGRDDGRARSGGPLRQGALCRHLLLQCAAHPRGRSDPRPPRHALPDPPAELLDDQPLGRGRRLARYAGRARRSARSCSRRWRRAC